MLYRNDKNASDYLLRGRANRLLGHLMHDDASVLTKRSGADSRHGPTWAASITDEHGVVRRRKSEFNSRPACHFFAIEDRALAAEFGARSAASIRRLAPRAWAKRGA